MRCRIRFTRWAAFISMLVCGAGAQAQLDYSIYGVADLSYGRFEPTGLYRTHRFNSNSLTATFAGVSGSYALENGWTPGITLEAFYRFQDRRFGRNDRDPVFSRNAFVSLNHREWGLFRAGRLQTLLFNTTTRFNAFGNSVGFSPAVRHLFTAGNLTSVQGDFYWNQAIGYTTPRVEGPFEGVSASFITARGERNSPGRLNSATIIASRGIYSGSLTYQSVSVSDGFTDPTRERTWQLGGNANFGWANVFGQYTYGDDIGLRVRSETYSVGATLPLGPGSVLAQYARSTSEGAAVARRHSTTSAGYVYAFDSVTDFYIVGMDDRARAQSAGTSTAFGVRYKF